MFFIFLLNICYALVCVIGKVALNYTSPLFLTGFRMTLGGFLVLGYQYFFRSNYFTVPKEAWKPLLWTALYAIYLTNWLEFAGLEHLTPAKTAFLYTLVPFSSALISIFYLGEKLSFNKKLGIGVGFLGSLPLLLSPDSASPELIKYWGLFSGPELALLASIIVYPLGLLFMQQAVCSKQCDTIMANGITMLIGGIIALIHSFITEGWLPLPITDLTGFLFSTFGLILFSNIICNTLYIEMLKKYSITFLAFTGFIIPLVTALLDWIIFGYKVPYTFYLSNFLIIVGFYLFSKEELL
jgi:drug/metabolite transporter (DMT)-like permease